MEESAEPRRLEDDGVPHDQRGDQRREGLVERVVERPHAEDDAERGAAHLRRDSLLDREARGRPVEVLQRLDRVADVVDRPVELLAGVGEALADLPHQEADDLLAVLPHPARKLLHAADPPLDRHRGPGAAPEVPRLHGRLEDLERLVGAERRDPTDDLGRGGRAAFVRLADR